MYTALGWVIDGVTLNNQNVHVKKYIFVQHFGAKINIFCFSNFLNHILLKKVKISVFFLFFQFSEFSMNFFAFFSQKMMNFLSFDNYTVFYAQKFTENSENQKKRKTTEILTFFNKM